MQLTRESPSNSPMTTTAVQKAVQATKQPTMGNLLVHCAHQPAVVIYSWVGLQTGNKSQKTPLLPWPGIQPSAQNGKRKATQLHLMQTAANAAPPKESMNMGTYTTRCPYRYGLDVPLQAGIPRPLRAHRSKMGTP